MFKLTIFLICALVVPFAVLGEDDGPIAQIKNGKIRGRTVTTRSGIEFYSFTDVPYAKPPLGELRFQPPQPAEDWDGVLDCTENTRICYNMGSDIDGQSEDCLLLNVYSPVPPGTNASLPVIYHIFSGGFVLGQSTFNSNGPHYFMEYDVVVVTMNYRVGPFGFLSTGDLTIPGNYGLKDQLLGLKWVQENIQAFGGDPEKVTVFGMSAGSASTTFQVMNKQGEGLFRAAMGESGSALCPFALQRQHKEVAYQLAKLVDPSFNESSSSEELLQLLTNVPAQKLNILSGQVHPESTDQIVHGFYYTPVVEPEHEGAFLTEERYELIKKGDVNKVPMMLGLGSEEVLGRVQAGVDQFLQNMILYDTNVSLIPQKDMNLEDVETLESVGKEIRSMYTDDMFQTDAVGSVKFLSDTSFSRPIIRHVELHSQYADAYLYIFSYHGEMGNNHALLDGAGKVRHSEYSNYIWAFDGNDNRTDYPESDITTSKRYVKMLVNFATHLNPTPEPDELLQNITFPKVVPGNYQYLDIDTDWAIKKDPKSPQYKKWVDLYDKYGVPPFDTY